MAFDIVRFTKRISGTPASTSEATTALEAPPAPKTTTGALVASHFTALVFKFSMNPNSWKEMILRSRELEYALGKPVKKVERNEKESIILNIF